MTSIKTIRNINVGVLGHVDSGKTSLCKQLSTTGSTAAFDSNPQSKERGITLDLGFSSLSLNDDDDKVQINFTLVDCPGHSSLIRTVIGGAQIMDIMLLIIDINKGMQPQAAECLILAHITCSHLIIVLNKLDLVPVDARPAKIAKVEKLMRSVLAKTKFGNEPIVKVSAVDSSIGTNDLKTALLKKVKENTFPRDTSNSFLMAVDHCFTIKEQGTIVTGTVLQGTVKVNDMIEFPSLRESKKVKSIQSFRKPVNEAYGGDRVGICVPGLDSSTIERTVVAATGYVKPAVRAGILTLDKIQFFKKPIQSKKRYHISIGYDTVTARLTLFKLPKNSTQNAGYDPQLDYEYVEELVTKGPDSSGDTKHQDDTTDDKQVVFALLEFDRPIITVENSLVIGSDLQSEDENVCRLAFSGRLVDCTQDKHYINTYLPSLKIYRQKSKQGFVDRIVSDNQLIAKGFCKKESNIDHLIGLKVSIVLATKDETDSKDDQVKDDKNTFEIHGRIESRFGQTNKVRLGLSESMSPVQAKLLKDNIKNAKVMLHLKKYFFTNNENNKAKLVQ